MPLSVDQIAFLFDFTQRNLFRLYLGLIIFAMKSTLFILEMIKDFTVNAEMLAITVAIIFILVLIEVKINVTMIKVIPNLRLLIKATKFGFQLVNLNFKLFIQEKLKITMLRLLVMGSK